MLKHLFGKKPKEKPVVKQPVKKTVNEIVQNCMNIVQSQHSWVKQYGNDTSARYEVYANMEDILPAFHIRSSFDMDSRSWFYILEFDTKEPKSEIKFCSNIDYGNGMDFSGLEDLYSAAFKKYKVIARDKVKKEYQSALDYTKQVMAKVQENNLQK